MVRNWTSLFAVTVTVAFNINACSDLAHVYIII